MDEYLCDESYDLRIKKLINDATSHRIAITSRATPLHQRYQQLQQQSGQSYLLHQTSSRYSDPPPSPPPRFDSIPTRATGDLAPGQSQLDRHLRARTQPRPSGQRPGRPDSVDTDSSVDSGVQSHASAAETGYAGPWYCAESIPSPAPGPSLVRREGCSDPGVRKDSTSGQRCRNFDEQRLPPSGVVLEEAKVCAGGERISPHSTAAMNGLTGNCRVSVEPRQGRYGVTRGQTVEGVNHGYFDPTFTRSNRELESSHYTTNGQHCYGQIAPMVNGWTASSTNISSSQFLYQDHLHARNPVPAGPIRGTYRGPVFDYVDGAVKGPRRSDVNEGPRRSDVNGGPRRSDVNGGPRRSDVNGGPRRSDVHCGQERGIREEFMRKRSNSSDSGYIDRRQDNAERHFQQHLTPNGSGGRASCLEAHQVSLSPSVPTTPLHANSKKSTTPNVIKRQLKTISEAVSPRRRSKSAQRGKSRDEGLDLGTSSEDEVRGERRTSKDSSISDSRVQLSLHGPLSASQNSTPLLEGNRGASVVLSPESQAQRKPRPLAAKTKFWSKRVGELKSAPSSPELSRRNSRIREISTNEHVTVRTPTNILQLTEGERSTLQKIAIERLQQLGLGPISIPKGGFERRKTLKAIFQRKLGTQVVTSEAFSRAGSGGAGTGSGLSGEPEKEKSSKSRHLTFGIPLEHCISNDVMLGRLPLPLADSQHKREVGGDQGCDSTRLLDALSLSGVEHPTTRRTEVKTAEQNLQVPHIVRFCCSYLVEHALRVKGLFRVAGLKTRVTQLRQDFDGGAKVKLKVDHSPHDIASLLKEYLRDLPQCLLTRDLYPAFIAVASLKGAEERQVSLRFLVSLLPVANRDTLWMLLSLLRHVADNSADHVTPSGEELPGNCMDSSNLATVFGPNILHRCRPGKSNLDLLEQLNQHQEVTAVVKDMINFSDVIFKLPEDVHREILHLLMEKNPEGAEYILCHQGADDVNRNNNACPRVSSDSSLRLLDVDGSRENTFTTMSSTISINQSISTPQKRDHNFNNSIQNTPTTQPRLSQNYAANRDAANSSANVISQVGSSSESQNSRHEQFRSAKFTKQNSLDFDQKRNNLPFGSNLTPDSKNKQFVSQKDLVNSPPYSLSLDEFSPAQQTAANQLTISSDFNGSSPSSSYLSVNDNQSSSSASLAGSWERQRWKYWEELAQKSSDELHEHQTLV